MVVMDCWGKTVLVIREWLNKSSIRSYWLWVCQLRMAKNISRYGVDTEFCGDFWFRFPQKSPLWLFCTGSTVVMVNHNEFCSSIKQLYESQSMNRPQMLTSIDRLINQPITMFEIFCRSPHVKSFKCISLTIHEDRCDSPSATTSTHMHQLLYIRISQKLTRINKQQQLLLLLLLLTACIPEAEAVHWCIWARDVWFRSLPLSLIKNGTMFLPPRVLLRLQVQTDAQMQSIVVKMWDAQMCIKPRPGRCRQGCSQQIMQAWFLGFGTRGSVPWPFIWLLKVANGDTVDTVENVAHQQMLSGVGAVPRRCHCAWCLLGTWLCMNLNDVHICHDVMHCF